MNGPAFALGVVIGAFATALISYYLISLILNIEDRANDRRRHRARRRFRPVPKEEG